MSTYTNFAIQDLAALNAYILRSLGSPLIIVEITQDQLTDCINDATEYFTKYVTFDNEYITLDVSLYTQDVGYQLPSNVSAIYALDDSSYPKAFVNGILEAKSFIVDDEGRFEELYDNFEKSLTTLPKRDADSYLREQILKFINSLG